MAALPPDERARMLQLAGVIAYVTGRLEIAEARYLWAVTLLEQQGKPAGADVAAVLNLLAVSHFRSGRYESSLALLARARSAVERDRGRDSPQLAHILVNHGSFVRDDCQSETSFGEALRIAESTLGREHPDTALVLEADAERLRRMVKRRMRRRWKSGPRRFWKATRQRSADGMRWI